MHILHTNKLATKPLKIKNQFKKTQKSQKQKQKYKIEKISQKYVQNGIWLSTPTPKSHNVFIWKARSHNQQ